MRLRRLLTLSTFLLAVAGLVIAMTPFMASLGPNAKSDANLPRIDISDLKPGTFRILAPLPPPDRANDFYWKLFVLRTHGGEIKAWHVPTRNGAVGMPDLNWYRPFFECKNFGPASAGGAFEADSVIKCHDENLPKWWASKWEWSLDGKALSNDIDDMSPAKISVEGRYLVYGKSS